MAHPDHKKSETILIIFSFEEVSFVAFFRRWENESIPENFLSV